MQGAEVECRHGLLDACGVIAVDASEIVDGNADEASSVGGCLGGWEAPVGPGVEAVHFAGEVSC